jgi:hypothetical protein
MPLRFESFQLWGQSDQTFRVWQTLKVLGSV